ncbi:hypothetical protein [Dactylosporangium sp. CA-092794]|uniref:hypothetical protein n=1 Tax=Dactylosporangium sp. CA-092794 TaxID=3239929 RepID=UPI003D8A4187
MRFRKTAAANKAHYDEYIAERNRNELVMTPAEFANSIRKLAVSAHAAQLRHISQQPAITSPD